MTIPFRSAIVDYIQNHDNKNKALWSIINSEMGKNKTIPTDRNNHLSANKFSQYFSKIGEQISHTIPGPSNDANVLMSNSNVGIRDSFFLTPVDRTEVLVITKQLSKKKDTGYLRDKHRFATKNNTYYM